MGDVETNQHQHRIRFYRRCPSVCQENLQDQNLGKTLGQSVNVDVTKVCSKEPEIVAKFRNTGRGTAGFATMHKVTLDTQVGLNKYTLLHELTHTLGHMHHGRSFRKTLLGMVGAFMGAKEKAILQAEFKKRKLAFGDARKVLEFDAWAERKARLTGVRIVFGEDDE